MDNNQFAIYNDIPQEKFEVVKNFDLKDKKIETKQVGYLRDAFRRFTRNKASVVAAVIIGLLLIFALFGPLVSGFSVDFLDNNDSIKTRLPKSRLFGWLGWDGCKNIEINEADFYRFIAIERETGSKVIQKIYGERTESVKVGALNLETKYYSVKLDTYTWKAMQYVQVTAEEYQNIQKYQDEHDVQIIYPAIPDSGERSVQGALWYKIHEKGNLNGLPINIRDYDSIDEYEFENVYIPYANNDNYTSTKRIEGETPLYNYAIKKQGGNYFLRVDYNQYFVYRFGTEPIFIFGSDQYGRDIFARLSSGARFSLIFAVIISAINLTIGAIYGSIEGYFGGATDLIMERISDILSGVPFMVVVTLFKLHIADKVGPVVTLLFAFVMTGWIGMAGTTRMQFYRYKNQEYVLAARTLGASNKRIMFKHIFPNALGTLVTSSVLVIPGVIFSESSLSYLGIIQLNTSNITSVGTLLANGQGYLSTYPHIILFPALFIALLMITFNLFGNGLRDAFNPSLRGTED